MSNMVVRTNVMSLNSHRSLGLTGNAQARASARLSSGFRINSAADDAAGLAISEKMRAQIRGLDQASRNAQDGISFIQVAEGALSTVNDMLIRIRELTNQAANDTNTGTTAAHGGSDRGQIAREIEQLQNEIREMGDRIEFNTLKIFDGSLAGGDLVSRFNLVSGVDHTALTTPELAQSFVDALALQDQIVRALGIQGTFTLTATSAGLASFNTMLVSLAAFAGAPTSAAAASLASAVASLAGTTTFANLFGVTWTGLVDPNTGALAEDFVTAAEQAARLIARIDGDGGLVWFQIGANAGQGLSISIDIDLNSIADDITNTHETISGATNLGGEVISALLGEMDGLLEQTNNQRAQLGAWQNRLEFTIENLDIASENLQAANSRVRDADMAREMMRLTQMNVLQQAAVAMLAQANQAPQMILQLLR